MKMNEETASTLQQKMPFLLHFLLFLSKYSLVNDLSSSFISFSSKTHRGDLAWDDPESLY